MVSLWQDLRYGFRGLRNQPAFTALAVLTLALGIGATTTMFSVVHNVLIDPFPYRDAGRVVSFQIRHADRPQQGGRTYFQTPEFLDYVAESKVFEEVIAGTFEDAFFTRTEGAELVTAGFVSGNNFSFLGVPATVGRTLNPADDAPGAPPVCVLSYKMWRKYFNLDAGVVGQSLVFNGAPATVVGVMPDRFTKLGADYYQPIVLDRVNPQTRNRYFMFQARLKPGISVTQAESELTVIAQRLAKVYPRNYPPKFIVKLVSWVDNLVGPFRKTLYTLAAAVGLLLLIACSNVASLLLARATGREKEMAIRASLGASRSRLIVQLMMESLLIALLAMAVGWFFAHFGIKVLAAVIPDSAIPPESRIRLNAPVLIFSLGLAGCTAMLFGLVPALQTVRKDLNEPLKDARKGGGGGFRRGKLRHALVVLEVALSLVLLVGAGLLIRSFLKLTAVDLGYNPRNVLVARLPFPRGPYDAAGKKQQFFRELLPRLQSLPGVTAVTPSATFPPFGGSRSEIDIAGRPRTQERWDAIVEPCGEGYFATLGLRLLRGRFFSDAEVNDARRVIVVNQAFVTQFLGEDDPIGRPVTIKRFVPAGALPADVPTFEIVGVIADCRNAGVSQASAPEVYLPYGVPGALPFRVMLRTAGEPLALLNSVRREVWSLDRGIAITSPDSLENYLQQYSYASPRFSLFVLSVFASVGLVLVILGVYSVISYTVSQRTHEIGIRMALGATRADVMRLVMRAGLKMIGLGIVVGTLASINLTNLLKQQLGGSEWTHDPVTLVVVVCVVTVAGLAACYVPARRATRVDPIVALRCE